MSPMPIDLALMADGLTLVIDERSAAIIGGLLAPAVTVVGKLYFGWRKTEKEAETKLHEERNGLVEKVIALTKESATAVAVGSKTLEGFDDRMQAMENEIRAFRSSNLHPVAVK